MSLNLIEQSLNIDAFRLSKHLCGLSVHGHVFPYSGGGREIA